MSHPIHARGYVPLHRQVMDSDVFSDEGLFHTFSALLLVVNWTPRKFKGRTVRPGQMVFAWRTLPERLQGSMQSPVAIGTLRRRISTLVSLGVLSVEATPKYSILTVVNWSKYQASVSNSDTLVDTLTDTLVDTDIRKVRRERNIRSTDVDDVGVVALDVGVGSVDRRRKSKKTKRRNASAREYSDAFVDWWNHYPRKVGKPAASRAFADAMARIVSERSLSESDALAWLIRRTDDYAQHIADSEPQHVKHPGPWLNDDRYGDDLRSHVASEPPAKQPKRWNRQPQDNPQ